MVSDGETAIIVMLSIMITIFIVWITNKYWDRIVAFWRRLKPSFGYKRTGGYGDYGGYGYSYGPYSLHSPFYRTW